MSEEVPVEIWTHPQGKTIRVYADDTWDCRGQDGKKKKTSATLESLRAGRGDWRRIR